MWNNKDFSELEGKTLTDVSVNFYENSITFVCNDNTTYKMFHQDDCCESVTIEDICGEIKELIGSPILEAYEGSNYGYGPLNDYDESYTWTFYVIRNVKETVTIRWYGTSNGYYSESVSFVEY